jgi:histone acetyltransferase (RNA polymerase elongator complex component)
MRPLVAPIFVPHQGCRYRCVFCEQQKITSRPIQPVNASHVEAVLDKAILSKDFNLRPNREVAFYGGTFTSLPLVKITELLQAVTPYLRQGFFQSIRVSTRPDSLYEDLLEVLRDYGVLTVELGAQSMQDDVLTLSERGHTAQDTVRAVELLRRYGFKVVIQLIPGLPGDSKENFFSTITKIIALRPDMARLYPALVISGTGLARWYTEGRYQPMALEQAIEICIESCIRLEDEGIPVIRIGLMSSPALLEKGQILAGPWHPAFGFLVRSGIHRKKIVSDLPTPGEASQIKIRVPTREIPLVRGYKNQGLTWIESMTGAKVIGVESDDSIPPGRVRIQKI